MSEPESLDTLVGVLDSDSDSVYLMESDSDPGSLLESGPVSCMLAGSDSVSDSLTEGFSCGRVSRANCLALRACRRTLAFLLRVKPAEGGL